MNLSIVQDLNVWFFSLDQGILKWWGQRQEHRTDCPFLSYYPEFGLPGCSLFVFWVNEKRWCFICSVMCSLKIGMVFDTVKREITSWGVAKKSYQLLDIVVCAIYSCSFAELLVHCLFWQHIKYCIFLAFNSGGTIPKFFYSKITYNKSQFKTLLVPFATRNN